MATSTPLGYDDLPDLLTRLTGDEKHDWSALSTVDVLWVLYDRVLRVDPGDRDDPGRDRFLLSKGHGPAAYYAVLAAKGFVAPPASTASARSTRRWATTPITLLIAGVEISSGSLGHGLPHRGGHGAGARRARPGGARVVVLVGDAELDEGSNWEAVRARRPRSACGA